jgi:FlaA1/EpsC-like NDP-sugar epimerase
MITFPRSLLILEGVFSLLLLGGLRVIIMLTERYSGDINWRSINYLRKANIDCRRWAAGAQMIKELNTNPQLGLKPVATMDDDEHKIGRRISGLPIFGPLARIKKLSKRTESTK